MHPCIPSCPSFFHPTPPLSLLQQGTDERSKVSPVEEAAFCRSHASASLHTRTHIPEGRRGSAGSHYRGSVLVDRRGSGGPVVRTPWPTRLLLHGGASRLKYSITVREGSGQTQEAELIGSTRISMGMCDQSLLPRASPGLHLLLLLLISCDGGELSFWEGEAVHSFSGQRLDLGQVHPRVVPDDVHTWLVFVHRLEDDLDEEGEEGV